MELFICFFNEFGQIIGIIMLYDIWHYFTHIFLHAFFCDFHNINHQQKKDTEYYVCIFFEFIFQKMGIFIPFLYIPFNYTKLLSTLCIIVIRILIKDNKHAYIHIQYPTKNFGEFWIDNIFETLHVNTETDIITIKTKPESTYKYISLYNLEKKID